MTTSPYVQIITTVHQQISTADDLTLFLDKIRQTWHNLGMVKIERDESQGSASLWLKAGIRG